VPQFIPVEVAGSEQTFDCDLAFLAMGFLGPEETLIEQFKLAADPRGNIKADFGKHYTSVDKVRGCVCLLSNFHPHISIWFTG
jgi:glutamate synthase (NADPH/NADH) small chain